MLLTLHTPSSPTGQSTAGLCLRCVLPRTLPNLTQTLSHGPPLFSLPGCRPDQMRGRDRHVIATDRPLHFPDSWSASRLLRDN
jgi:hypothetical protein